MYPYIPLALPLNYSPLQMQYSHQLQGVAIIFIAHSPELELQLNKVRLQQFQMRNRYFSPESIHYSANLQANPTNNSGRLKWAGSTSKLHSYNSILLSDSERKIGSYFYDVAKEIGSGYSSKVFKGRSSKDDSDCAVKVIELKKYSESSLKMLDSEIEILKTLDHPNVIKCLDVYKTATHCFIINQYCSGGDLLSYIVRRGKLQETVAVEVMSQILEGIKYTLSRGILHRDLKPANILNNRKNWKIADFGFAIYSEAQIKTKYNVGTPLYMPLEALVKNIYSPSSDIFSFGVIFYELLTGITPWECKNEKELIKKMNSLPYCLSERFKISASNRQLLERLCSLDREQRLTKEEFLSLQLKKEDNPELQEKKTGKKGILERSQNLSAAQQILKSTSNINLLSCKSLIVEKQVESKSETRNNHILISQLHYCRFIYYLTRNLTHLTVKPKSRNKITLILFKHLQRLIKNLSDDKGNWFHLNNWDNFKESKKYYTTLLTMKEYSVRYEKEYLNYLKKSDLATIREINKEFNDNTSPEAFTTNFYKEISNSIAPIIREANHNLTVALSEPMDALTSQLKISIQVLKSLFKYYTLVQLSLSDFQNYDNFQKKSDIKVQIDYRSLNSATVEQFMQLRQNLKFI